MTTRPQQWNLLGQASLALGIGSAALVFGIGLCAVAGAYPRRGLSPLDRACS